MIRSTNSVKGRGGIVFTACLLTDVTPKVADNSISVYPNPSSGRFEVAINTPDNDNEFEIKIFDSVGKLVSKLKTRKKSNEIDLSTFSEGVYFVMISGTDFFQAKKIIIY